MGAAAPVVYGFVAIASAAVTAYSAYEQRREAKAAAAAAEENKEAAEAKTKFDIARKREEIRRWLSAQKALYGKAGIDFSKGSPLLVLQETRHEGELDLEALRLGGAAASRRFGSEADIYNRRGDVAWKTGMLQAGTSLLTKYADYKYGGGGY